MKKIFIIFSLIGLTAQAALPQWSLEHAEQQQHFNIMNGIGVLETNRLIVLADNSDVHVNIKVMSKFKAAEYPFFALRYRAVSSKTVGGIFFATKELPNICDKSFTPFGIIGDGKWHNQILDMRVAKKGVWQGEVKSVRIDPLNPSEAGDEFDIARIGFFPSREAAEAFCVSSNDSIEVTKSFNLNGSTYRALIPASQLKSGWRRENFAINEPRATNHSSAAVSSKPPYHSSTLDFRLETLDFTFLMVCRDGVPVPCHFNSRGFAFYRAELPGRYTIEPATDKALSLSPEDARALGADVTSAHPRSYFEREHIRLGAWALMGDSVWRPKMVRDFVDCGMDFLVAFTVDSTTHRINLLRECNNLGVEVVLTDGSANSDPEHAGMDCADQPCYYGHQFSDEPGTDNMPELGERARFYRQKSGKIPFINLLPMYANAAQLKYGARAAAIKHYDKDPNLYRKYCESFCKNVDVPYISTDIYPLLRDKEGRRWVYPDYVESINVIADVARKHNREFWCYVLCYDYRRDGTDRRDPTVAEIRWQCYSMLSFGCRNILCWIYYFLENLKHPGLVTTDGTRTPAWYNTRIAFNEIKKLSDVYVQYRNLGAFTHNCSAKTPYLRMTNEYKNFAAIRRLECPDPLLIGCFEKKADPTKAAFTLVNMSNLETGGTTLVTLDLGGKNVTVHRNGLPTKVATDSDGLVRIPLALGEGVFVTLD